MWRALLLASILTVRSPKFFDAFSLGESTYDEDCALRVGFHKNILSRVVAARQASEHTDVEDDLGRPSYTESGSGMGHSVETVDYSSPN